MQQHDKQDKPTGTPERINNDLEQNASESAGVGGLAAQPQPAGGGGSVSPPCNTDTDGYREKGDKGYHLLRAGIDSLYLTFHGDVFPAIDNELGQLKHLAQSPYPEDKAQAQKQLGSHIFEVSAQRQRIFPYVLVDGAFRICVKSGDSKRLPLAWVQVSADILAHKPAEQIVDELKAIIEELGEGDGVPTVSRVDICADFVTSTNFDAIPDIAWVTQGDKLDRHVTKGELTGWSFSPGGILSARLYDKTREIEEISKKTYLHDLWKLNGWDGQSKVWRMEFQFQREILTALRTGNFDQVKDRLGSLWQTATTSWLRLTIPSATDSNRSRWPTHPTWGKLQALVWRLDDMPLTRRYTPARVPSDSYLARTSFAVTTSYMAKYNVQDYDAGARGFHEMMKATVGARCREKFDLSFEEHVAQQVAVKTRQFNARMNTRTPEQEATTPDEVERAAKDYDDESNGA